MNGADDDAPRFGLYLPQLRMDVATIVARAQAAEAAGFDQVWFMDHLAAPSYWSRSLLASERPPGRVSRPGSERATSVPPVALAAPAAHDTYEAWTIATAVAVRTERIRVGHLTLADPLRHPAVLAKMAATLDHVSGGRLDLGLGWGSVEAELRAFGIADLPAAARARRLRETLEILELMNAGEPFDYDGEHFSLRGAIGRPVPLQHPLPVHIGGGGRRLTLPLVRDHAQWWNCPGYALDRFEELRPLAGDVRVSVQRPIGLVPPGGDPGAVGALAERRFGAWGGLVVGDAAEVADVLAADRARGVDGFVLQFHDFGQPPTLEHFAAAVMPRVRATR